MFALFLYSADAKYKYTFKKWRIIISWLFNHLQQGNKNRFETEQVGSDLDPTY